MARINDAGSFKNAMMRATGRIVVGLKSKGDKPQKRDIFAGEEIFMEYGKGRDEDGAWTDDHIIPKTAYGATEEDMLRCHNKDNHQPLGVSQL